MTKTKRRFDIRVGDEWVLTTNTGGISRTITGIDTPDCWKPKVYYRSYGDYGEKECLIPTFRRWWRGARLEAAKDWEDRGEDDPCNRSLW